MNILDRIKADHDDQRSMMGEIEKTVGDTEKRREEFAAFAAEFKAHAAAEEHAFYAPLMKIQNSTDQSRHSVAEHHEAMELLESLSDMDMSSPVWLKTFKKLSHDNEHHMEEEENEVFKLARDNIDEDELINLLEEFDTRKQKEEA